MDNIDVIHAVITVEHPKLLADGRTDNGIVKFTAPLD